jgi:glycosyltransferase involved in cell wall biosynthesis
MSAVGPLATIVIPTHDRVGSVLTTLAALEAQDCGSDAFEVVVVANGCTDDAVARLQAHEARYRLRVVPIDAPGASLARNAGAERARAPLVIFLDDEVVPSPSFVSAHCEAHHMRPGARTEPWPDRVVIGYMPAVLPASIDRFAITKQARWESRFDALRQPDHRFDYTDLFSGNFSMSRVRFLELGGFDISLRRREGRELGYRLIANGVRLVFAERAAGSHPIHPKLGRFWQQTREDAHADVQLAQQHAPLRAVPLERSHTWIDRVVYRVAFRAPAVGELCARWLTRCLPLLDRVGAGPTWQRTLDVVLAYWYARGLRDAVGTRDALDRLVADRANVTPGDAAGIEVDLAGGLRATLHEVDRVRPLALTLFVASRRIGRIPWRPGAERLAGRHLAGALVSEYSVPLFEALHGLGHVRLTAPPLGATPDL